MAVGVESTLDREVRFEGLSSWRKIDFACIRFVSITKFIFIFTASRSPNSTRFLFSPLRIELSLYNAVVSIATLFETYIICIKLRE